MTRAESMQIALKIMEVKAIYETHKAYNDMTDKEKVNLSFSTLKILEDATKLSDLVYADYLTRLGTTDERGHKFES